MWDVVGGDFDPSQTSENIVNNIVNNTKSGSIIVLHDSEKFGDKMLIALPKIIKELKDKGFNFLPINS
jgi:peptidoglycan/xylan/chitin deacetylase (PgdA/CDA1 family)